MEDGAEKQLKGSPLPWSQWWLLEVLILTADKIWWLKATLLFKIELFVYKRPLLFIFLVMFKKEAIVT